jgi:hypothetical protein
LLPRAPLQGVTREASPTTRRWWLGALILLLVTTCCCCLTPQAARMDGPLGTLARPIADRVNLVVCDLPVIGGQCATPTLPPQATPPPVSTASATPGTTPTLTATSPSSGGSVPTSPPAECQPSWLPDSGCTCCGSTLVCADGSVGEFNPQCTGSGGCTCQLDPATGGYQCAETGAVCTP